MLQISALPPADYLHRPERKGLAPDKLQTFADLVVGRRYWRSWWLSLRRGAFLAAVNKHAQALEAVEESQLIARARQLGQEMSLLGFAELKVAEMFAIIREVAFRIKAMKHFDSQIVAGRALLFGQIVEMNTGEGKTFAAILPMITAGLSGLHAHVITVNDYLTQRDAQEMGPLYERFGLTCAFVTHSQSLAERRAAYACDVVYVTGNELVFDYLKDTLQLPHANPARTHVASLIKPWLASGLMLRGLFFAIVDEADSVLIDESRTPLIISEMVENQREADFISEAYALSEALEEGRDFVRSDRGKGIEILPAGALNIQDQSHALGPVWRSAARRDEIIEMALTARYRLRRDVDYIVREGKVQLVDPLTGRVMEGRSWERGLHQLVELKEQCELSKQRTTKAQISFQRFFRRYFFLSGMTGTAREVKHELWNVYRLGFVRIRPQRPLIRRVLAPKVFLSDADWAEHLVARCRSELGNGRAVLIGTTSVATSEQISGFLAQAGIDHSLLSAKQDKQEAEIVAAAGQQGVVTIATNMAGRGTDIKLAETVRQHGGLHVILTEHYESARVDRQLAGRCARQGDPGSFEMIMSIQDRSYQSAMVRNLVYSAQRIGSASRLGQRLLLAALKMEQGFVERQNQFSRQSTLENDTKSRELFAFSGTRET